MNQWQRAVPKKTAVHVIDYKISKILEKHPRKSPTPTETADIVPAALLEMNLTTGIPQVYIWLFYYTYNYYFKENPWMDASTYTIYNES